MPSSKSYKHPKTGIVLTFDEESHTYTSLPFGEDSIHYTEANNLDLKINYRSVSTWVGKWFTPFDAMACAQKVAAKRETLTTVDDVLREWEEKKNAACTLGTRVHEVCEDVLLNRAIRNTPANEREKKLMFHGFNKAKEVREKSETICVEQMLFDPFLVIAGTADIITVTPDKVVNILDWKTNEKEIGPDTKCFQYGHKPIDWIPDNSYWHYVLQLNMYQFLIQRMEIFPRDTKFRRALFHLTENGVKTIPIPEYGNLIRDMVIYALTSRAEIIPF